MGVSKIENYCNGCGFTIVTVGPYHPTCPICGEPLGTRKPTSAGRPVKNKKQSAKEK